MERVFQNCISAAVRHTLKCYQDNFFVKFIQKFHDSLMWFILLLSFKKKKITNKSDYTRNAVNDMEGNTSLASGYYYTFFLVLKCYLLDFHMLLRGF